MPDAASPAQPATLEIGEAVEHLVASLPPKGAGSVPLKDVLDYSLEETAELVDSTVGAVKAASSTAVEQSSLPRLLPAKSARRARAQSWHESCTFMWIGLIDTTGTECVN